MTLKLPNEFEGINGKEAYEKILAEDEEKEKKKEQEKAENSQTLKSIYTPEKDTDKFIYVPSLNLYFTNERILTNNDWNKCHEKLNNSEVYNTKMKMPTIPEFWEFLRHLNNNKENNEQYKNLFNDITQVKSLLRAEWLDADFKYDENKGFYVNYHIFDSNGKIIQKSENLDENTLLKKETPGISLEKILQDPKKGNNQLTKQELPTTDMEKGDLYYFAPMKDNNSVAWFDAGSVRAVVGCNWYPSDSDSSLGVFGVAQYLNDNAH